MTNQLKESIQETLTQLNKRTGDFGEFSFNDYIFNTNKALNILLHGVLDHLENEEEPTKQHIISDKDDTVELINAGLALLHKKELVLNEQQTKDILQSAEMIKGIPISNEDKSGNITLTEGKIYHTGEIKSEQIKGSNLKDQNVNLTVNIDYNEANETAKEFGKRINKVLEDAIEFAHSNNSGESKTKKLADNLKELLKDTHEYYLEDDKTLFRIQKISL